MFILKWTECTVQQCKSIFQLASGGGAWWLSVGTNVSHGKEDEFPQAIFLITRFLYSHVVFRCKHITPPIQFHPPTHERTDHHTWQRETSTTLADCRGLTRNNHIQDKH